MRHSSVSYATTAFFVARVQHDSTNRGAKSRGGHPVVPMEADVWGLYSIVVFPGMHCLFAPHDTDQTFRQHSVSFAIFRRIL